MEIFILLGRKGKKEGEMLRSEAVRGVWRVGDPVAGALIWFRLDRFSTVEVRKVRRA